MVLFLLCISDNNRCFFVPIKWSEVRESELYRDLAEYLMPVPEEIILERLKYSPIELAYLWHKRKAERKSTADFYRENDLYLFDLTVYQVLLESAGNIQKMIGQVCALGEGRSPLRVLEFGGGIANFSIRLSRDSGLDLETFYYDLDGPIKDYALWRMKKHNQGIGVFGESRDPFGEGKWDFVNVMDVLEHLDNPGPVIEKLAKSAEFIFVNPEEIAMDALHPQHISHYDISGDFRQIDGNLWKNKN